MRYILILTLFLCTTCKAQNSFDGFVKKNPVLSLPVDSVQFLPYKDTMDVKMFNYFMWDTQPLEEIKGKMLTARPKVYKNEKLINLMSFGKADYTPSHYETVDGKEGYFYSKVYPVGRINLHPDYISIIVKQFSSEISYYDLYTFTKDGKRLSAVNLFTYYNKKMMLDKIGYVLTKSTILKDGSIHWFDDNKGLKTNRVYKLRDDGYFEIVQEERTGEFEY